jgi:hypothetical protein
MAETAALILPTLGDMRAEITTRFDGVDARLEALEKAQVSSRQALSGDSVMPKLVTVDFEDASKLSSVGSAYWKPRER